MHVQLNIIDTNIPHTQNFYFTLLIDETHIKKKKIIAVGRKLSSVIDSGPDGPNSVKLHMDLNLFFVLMVGSISLLISRHLQAQSHSHLAF